MTQSVECPNCGGIYEHIGQHWSKGDVCREPPLSEKQKDVITGCLMGDGCIDKNSKNPAFLISVTKREYLEYLDTVLDIFSTGVSLRATAEECAELNRKRGFRPNAKAENYSDQYKLSTRNLQQLNEFYDWYSSGKKVWPENVDLTPTVLKHWYVCDGSYSIKEESDRGSIVIAVNNEKDNQEKLNQYFLDSVGVEVDYWREYKDDCAMVFHADTSEQLFEYMGEPLPSFEYKWPN
jgi:hypothetical protein